MKNLSDELVHKEVRHQTHEIGKFIKERISEGEDTNTFRVLQALFSLYKTESSISSSLRKSLKKEKESKYASSSLCSAQKLEAEYFLHQISQLYNSDFKTFEQMIDYLSKERTSSTRIQEKKHKYKTKYKSMKIEITKIKQENEQIKAQCVVEVAALHSQIEREKANVTFLQKKCSALENALTKKEDEVKKQISDSQDKQEFEIFQTKCENKILKYKNRNDTLKELVRGLSTRLEEMDVNPLKDINEEKTEENEKLKKKLKKVTKELDFLRNENSKLAGNVQQMASKVSELKKQNFEPVFEAFSKIRDGLELEKDAPPNVVTKAALKLINKNREVSFDLQSEISALQREIASMEKDISPNKL